MSSPKKVKRRSLYPRSEVGSIPAFAFTGYAIGYGLDYLFSTHFLRLVFLLLGVAAGLVQVVRELTHDHE